MKYSKEIVINLPRNKVVELFDNPDNMKKWMKGLQSFEHLSGVQGQEGAKSKLAFDMNGRKIEMIETITKRNLPDEFSGTYEAKGVFNIQENFFKEEDKEITRWITTSEFQLGGFMKLMGLLMPGSFQKETLKHMQNFKEFAEKS
jgi:carbon monoxide dehydrogenase subunit G